MSASATIADSQSSPVRAGGERVIYTELDSLRGLAALSVVFFHVYASIEPSRKVFSDYGMLQGGLNFLFTGIFNGTAAVTLFFVISGFALSCNMDSAKSITLHGYSDFVVRRLFRIMPALWSSIILTVVLNWLIYQMHYPWRDIYHYFILQDTRINGTFWSLQVELVASVLFPFLLFISIRFGIALNIALLGWMIMVSLGNSPFVIMFLYCFLLGILVHRLGPGLMALLNRPVRILLMVIAVLSFLVPVQLSRLGLMSSREHLLFEAIASFYILCFVLFGKFTTTKQFLQQRWVLGLGKVSYSLYVIHYTISGIVLNLFFRWFGHGLFDTHPLIVQTICLPWVIGISICLAWLNYRLIEAPFHRAGRSIARTIGNHLLSLNTAIVNFTLCPTKTLSGLKELTGKVAQNLPGILLLGGSAFLYIRIVTAALKL